MRLSLISDNMFPEIQREIFTLFGKSFLRCIHVTQVLFPGVRLPARHLVGPRRRGVGQGQLAAAGDRLAAGTHTQLGALLQRGWL